MPTFTGTPGNDNLTGTSGNDVIYSRQGNDTVASGRGIDFIWDEGGNDTYRIQSIRTSIYDAGGSDTAIVAVSHAKLPSTLENVSYVEGAQPLPYWISALLPDEAAGMEYLRLMGDGLPVYRYAFPTTPPAYLTRPADLLDWQAFSPRQIERAREALDHVSAICGLRFVETTDLAQINTLSFATNNQGSSGGYAYYPSNYSPTGGDLFLNRYRNDNATLADGEVSAGLLMHELGHALGLEHPFATADVSGQTADPPYLQGAEDNGAWTMMSYQRSAAQYALRYSPLDIAALQYLYGPSPTSRTGDDRYQASWSEPTFVWDGAGNDTIDLSNAPLAADVSLAPGYWGFLGARGDRITTAGQITVNFGTVIENLLGSSRDDLLAGNDVGNRIEGGAGNDAIDGAAGDDELVGDAGHDALIGGAGRDTAVFLHARSAYTILTGATSMTGIGSVSGTGPAADEGTDTLSGIERLRFADRSVALDLGGNAGIAAKVLGATFGPATVANPAFNGIALYATDTLGMNLEALVQLALGARLGPAPSHAQVFDTLFLNLFGVLPDAGLRNDFVAQMDAGVFTPVSLGVLVADSELNRTNIDFAGLTARGLEYLPFGV